MDSIGINFSKNGCTLDVDRTTSGFATLVQKGLVNVGTATGSDPLYPNRGTALTTSAATGAVVGYDNAYHLANFAALRTLIFLKATDPDEITYERMSKVKLQPTAYTGTQISLNAQFIGEDGTTVGTDLIV